jgi:hypothetical protein
MLCGKGDDMPRNSNNDDQRGAQSRERDEDGRFTSGSQGRASSGGRSHSEDSEFEDWHAYGHDRGWHAHQQGRHGQANRNRDEDGRFTSSGRGSQGRGESSGQGRGWHGDPEGHARAGSMSHGGTSGGRDYEDDDDDRSSRDRASANRERDDNGRFASNRH